MFRKRISWISFVWVVSSGWMISIATAAPPASLPAAESSLHGFALLDTDHLQECSGVIASRVNPDVLWMHDDSGSAGPRVWAVRLDASDLAAGVARELGWVELAGATNDDWEDISGGPGHSMEATTRPADGKTSASSDSTSHGSMPLGNSTTKSHGSLCALSSPTALIQPSPPMSQPNVTMPSA